jgi:NRPS condensation-like uncharacterized protein
MTTSNFKEFSVDNASVLFLSLLRPYHTNSFRFSAVLTQPISPEALQQAVNRIHLRFPSIVAGFRKGFFHYRQVAAENPPIVQPDPGLLMPMTSEELKTCAFRVYYKDCTIAVELFHALTDGCGTIALLTALVGEYLRITLPDRVMPPPLCEPKEEEVVDSFLDMTSACPKRLPSRFSYLLPRSEDADWTVRGSSLTLPTASLLAAAHRYGVTLNTLLTAVMASTVMEMQVREKKDSHLKPVRIMVPVNLRKMIGSRTLRNFSLYALPTMEAEHRNLPLTELCKVIDKQLKEQLSPENQAAMVSANVRSQNAWYYRAMPWALKRAALRIGYRFFGESNSSVTLTNLGIVRMPEEIRPYVADFLCQMTPRVSSPYGCTVLSFGDNIMLNMSRFCPDDQLGVLFFRNVKSLIAD